MPYFDRRVIQELSRFKTEPFWATSVFLATDKSSLSKKQIILNFKNLMAEARNRLPLLNLSKDVVASLEKDVEAISQQIPVQLNSLRHPGLAVFSCSARNFFTTYHLPHPPRNRIIFDPNLYLRPMIAILARFHRICVLLLSRREAKWYEVFMGEASFLESLTSNVPSKVREGGWEGYESKRIERHIQAHVHDHLKQVSQKTFNLFKQNQFDWLLLGCEDKLFNDFEPRLHAYLKERFKGRIEAKISDSLEKIKKEVVDLETKLSREEELQSVSRLVAELEAGGAAVAGLKETLRQLNANNVQLLLVTHNFSRGGRFCPSCKLLFLEEKTCPVCHQSTKETSDIVDEALGLAMDRSCPVRHITPPSRLDHYGRIGAFIRYKA